MNYPTGDFLIRIKNGSAVDKKTVTVDWSKKLEKIAEIIKKYGFISSYSVSKDKIKRRIIVEIAYDADDKPMIKKVRLFSKPGRRFYTDAKNLPYKSNPNGIIIISTSQQIMTADEARKKNLGGEVIAEIC